MGWSVTAELIFVTVLIRMCLMLVYFMIYHTERGWIDIGVFYLLLSCMHSHPVLTDFHLLRPCPWMPARIPVPPSTPLSPPPLIPPPPSRSCPASQPFAPFRPPHARSSLYLYHDFMTDSVGCRTVSWRSTKAGPTDATKTRGRLSPPSAATRSPASERWHSVQSCRRSHSGRSPSLHPQSPPRGGDTRRGRRPPAADPEARRTPRSLSQTCPHSATHVIVGMPPPSLITWSWTSRYVMCYVRPLAYITRLRASLWGCLAVTDNTELNVILLHVICYVRPLTFITPLRASPITRSWTS